MKRKRRLSWLLMVVLGAVTSVASFLIGYVLVSGSDRKYPYALASAASSAYVRSGKVPWIFIAAVTAISLLSMGLGAAAGDSSTFGIGSYYGVFRRDAP
jgi:hypothetical protein